MDLTLIDGEVICSFCGLCCTKKGNRGKITVRGTKNLNQRKHE